MGETRRVSVSDLGRKASLMVMTCPSRLKEIGRELEEMKKQNILQRTLLSEDNKERIQTCVTTVSEIVEEFNLDAALKTYSAVRDITEIVKVSL